MEKEFVTYEQALALKELGFDEEPCLAFYDGEGTEQIYFNSYRNRTGDFEPFIKHKRLLWFGAPLKQQVFRWFREKYGWYANLSSWIHEPELGTYHEYEIYGTPDSAHGWTPFKTYEEAENAAIDKLIELAKQQ
jgi:hypothetical protein